jgi:hypothetical protein
MLSDLAIQRISMDAQNRCSFRLISFCFAERGLNKPLFELAYSLVEIDSTLDHFRD